MSEEKNMDMVAETLAEQLQAGHRSRMNMNNVLFHEVQPDESYVMKAEAEKAEQNKEEEGAASDTMQKPMRSQDTMMPESYLNYAAQLLEQMRGVYSTSWDSCSNGSIWHGGHNHFYNPCSGADVVSPQSHNCPTYDCSNQCGCASSPQPAPYPAAHEHTCHGGTATYYDDCAYKLQKICDQLNRIEAMIGEMYSTNQQLFSYLIEYYNVTMSKSK